jgi:hypothetical protein
MPYIYEDRVRGEARNALTVPSATRDVLTETFAQAYEENPIKAARRYMELSEDQRTGPRLTAESARKRLADAGMDEIVVGENGITDAALLTLMDRKRVERRRQEVFAAAEGGVGQTAARFGIAAATTLVDPLGAGLNFVPIVGQARYARALAAARGFGGRAAVRVGVGAVEGAAGAAIAEVPIYAMRSQEQADYDMGNSLLNVAFGGVIGAGLHTTVGSVAEMFDRHAIPASAPQLAADTVRYYHGGNPEGVDGPLWATSSLEDARGWAARGADMDIWYVDVPKDHPLRGGDVANGILPNSRIELPADLAAQRKRLNDQPGTAQRVVDELPPEVQHAALRAAVGQAVEGRPIHVEPIIRSAELADPLLERIRTDGELRLMLQAMRDETGWAQVGGRVIRDGEQNAVGLVGDGQGEVIGRTQWIPRAEWWPGRPKGLNEEQVQTAVDKAVRGSKLSKREREMVEFMRDVADERNRLTEYLPTADELEVDGLRGVDDAYEAALVARAAAFDDEAVERLAIQYDDDADGFLQEIKKLVDENAAAASGGAAREQQAPRSLAESAPSYVDTEYSAATTHAEQSLARDVDPTVEANLKAANDEFALAESDAKLLAERLGVKYDTAEQAELDESVRLAERWARAAELATVCLVRGG